MNLYVDDDDIVDIWKTILLLKSHTTLNFEAV